MAAFTANFLLFESFIYNLRISSPYPCLDLHIKFALNIDFCAVFTRQLYHDYESSFMYHKKHHFMLGGGYL
jgi:hypothetical protein